MGRTVVWIQASVLAKAFGKEAAPAKKKSPSIDLNRSGGTWQWTRCELINGDVSMLDSSPLNVEVFDEDSEFKGKAATIEPELLKPGKDGPKVVMANEFTAADDSVPDDLITLTHLHEPSVVFSLRKRYEQNIIYTATGPVLIALNPFKALPALYDDVAMNDYWMAGEKGAELNLKPHIYQNAHGAFRSMMQGIEMQEHGMQDEISIANQSLLVSGESGAGKTVTTKHVMKYLASLSQRKATFGRRRRDASPGRSEPSGARRTSSIRTSRALSWKAGALVEERILESNPILEAFGNARTLRNDNSSRFGKFIELQFKRTGSLVGARIETYLLEKVRLVHQSEGERNFHIFYELLSASLEEERAKYLLGDYTVEHFMMTNSSGTYHRRDGADDAELYDDLVLGMSTMGFQPDTQEDIFSCSAAFLHASNLTFSAPTEESSQVDDSNPHLEPVLQLLGLEKDAFNSAMTENELEIGHQTFTQQLTVDGAQQALEALIKGTYSAMFSFIVNTVNKRIDYKPARGVPNLLGKAATISVLDIFGFESFKLNSFEQLCINYCNEALQQQFNLFIFKNEQEEYKKEGIEWDFIEFPDNREVLDLIDQKATGILSILTDLSRAPRTTDKTFVEVMYKKCENHPRFISSALHKGKGEFIIDHYAGLVMYDSSGFLEKNKDETPWAASALLESSTKDFVQLLGKISSGNDSAAKPGARSSKKRPTLGSQFSSQLTDLRNRIDQTKPHYIRCLKPNQSLQSDDFECAMIAEQLRCAGVLEAIRVSRVGFSQRYTHQSFFSRYIFLAKELPGAGETEKKIDNLVDELAKMLWADQKPNTTIGANVSRGIQTGATKVFLRQPAFDSLEKMRNQVLAVESVKIQSVIRRFVYHRRFLRIMHRIVLAQAGARRFLARKHLRSLQQRRAAICIQACVRFFVARKRFVGKRSVALLNQKLYRVYAGRIKYKMLQAKRKEAQRLDNAATIIQSMSRVRVARKVYAKLKLMERQTSVEPPEFQRKVFKETIKAHRKAAVSRQEAMDRAREVDDLTTNLANAKNSAAKAELVIAELESLRAVLAATEAELEKMKEVVATKSNRVTELEGENVLLKEKLESGDSVAGERYDRKIYSEFPDLEKLDRQMLGMVSRSKKSKADVKALVSSLAVLR